MAAMTEFAFDLHQVGTIAPIVDPAMPPRAQSRA
jgi:hypothetical protein